MKWNMVCFLFALLVSSCDGGKKQYAYYEIVNQSDFQIELQVFDRNQKMAINNIFIDQLSGSWRSIRFVTSEPDDNFGPPEIALGGDSVRILFMANRESIFVATDVTTINSSTNPYNPNNYSVLPYGNNEEIYRFTITNENYQNAEIID